MDPDDSLTKLAPTLSSVMRQIMVLCDGSPAACLKGQQLQSLCDSLNKEVLPVFSASDAEQLRLAVICCNGLPRLVATVLSARKRARDWKQIEYSRKVQAVLVVSTAVMRALDTLALDQPTLDPAFRMRAANVLVSCDAIAKVAAAATEVSQLLLASQDGQQQHQKLQQLACDLLAWWVAAHRVCATAQQDQLGPGQDRPPALRNFIAVQSLSESAELAAALAQTLPADSPQEQIAGLLDAAGYLCSFTPVQLLKHSKELLHLFSRPAFLQLSLAMLLLHSYSAQQAVSARHTGSRDVASDSSSQGNAGNSTSSSSSRSCGGAARTSEQEREQQEPQQGQEQQQQQEQQELEQLACITQQLWQGAGLAPALLPHCAAAFRASQLPQGLPPAQQCDPGQQLQSECRKHTLGFINSANAISRSLGMSALGSAKPQPQQQQQLGQSSVAAGPQTKQRPSFEQLPRQYQQLLQATVWLLPQFILHSALLCFEGDMALIEVAADCVQNVLLWWCLSGLYPSAAAAVAAAAQNGMSSSRTAPRATGTVQPLQQLVPPLVDVWLLLTKRVLLQQPDGLVHRAAATEQHLPVDSELAKQVRGSAYCRCLRHAADVPAQKVSVGCEIQCNSCVTLSCVAQYALGSLLAALQRLAITSNAITADLKVPALGWRGHAVSLAVVLEVIVRKLLPHYTLCSGSSSSSSGSSSTPGPGSGGSSSSSSTLSESHSNTSDVTPGLHAANAAPFLQSVFGRCMGEVRPGQGLKLVVLLAQQCQHRQLFSLLASAFKLWRCQPETQQQLSLLNGAGGAAVFLTKSVVRTLSLPRDVRLAHTPGLPIVHASLFPWLLLLSLYLSTAGQWLLAQIWVAPVSRNARHLQRKFDDMDDTLPLLRVARDALQIAHKQWKEIATQDVQKQQGGCFVTGAAEQTDQIPSMSAAQQSDTQQQKQRQQQEQSQQQRPAEPPAPADVTDVAGPGYQILEQLLSKITDKDLKGCQDVVSAAAAHAATLAGQPTAGSRTSGSRVGSSSTSSDLGCWQDEHTPGQATSERHEEVLAAINSIKAAQTLEQCWEATRGAKLLKKQVVSLQLEGARLSNNLPVAWLCNNVNLCRNLGGASEQQLIGGSSCVCGGCKVARYCSPSCQAQHWFHHKHACKHLAAAAATAAAAVAAGSSSSSNHG